MYVCWVGLKCPVCVCLGVGLRGLSFVPLLALLGYLRCYPTSVGTLSHSTFFCLFLFFLFFFLLSFFSSRDLKRPQKKGSTHWPVPFSEEPIKKRAANDSSKYNKSHLDGRENKPMSHTLYKTHHVTKTMTHHS